MKRRHANLLAGSEPFPGRDPLAVDPHLAGPQELVQPRSPQLRIVQQEPTVEAKLSLVLGDGPGFDAAHGTLGMLRKSSASYRFSSSSG